MSTSIPLADQLNKASLDLLDLSARNRLVNTSRSVGRTSRLDIVDELATEVFRLLVAERKKMTFLACLEDEEGEGVVESDGTPSLPQPEDGEMAERHSDTKLQTNLKSDKLQNGLLKLFRDARTFEEEQGVNILYLALGFLKWREDERSTKDRFAPLILVPVTLERPSVGANFRLAWTEDDLATNLSLQAKLKAEFGIEIPDLPEVDGLDLHEYYDEIQKAIAAKKEWSVDPNDMTVWFFSFSKFLMYRDLQVDSWPHERPLHSNSMMQSLLEEGFESDPPICGEHENVDNVIDVKDMVHVMDADSSQAIAIEEVSRGRSMVIQGPPGTGKSQTITNLIASSIKKGKTVLFVAEKMAALEVVKRRCTSVGLGDTCLELHSHKANKKLVLHELGRTLELGRPKIGDVDQHVEELTAYRDQLNRHAQVLHTKIEPCGLTPYRILGNLIRLRAAGVTPGDFESLSVDAWSLSDFRERLSIVHELANSVAGLGVPVESKWLGVNAHNLLPTDVDRIRASIGNLVKRLDELIPMTDELSNRLNVGNAETASHSSQLARLAQAVVAAPPMDRKAFGDSCWAEATSQIEELVNKGKSLKNTSKDFEGVVADVAWDTDVTGTRKALAAHGKSPFKLFIPAYHRANSQLAGILATSASSAFDDAVHTVEQEKSPLRTEIKTHEIEDFVSKSMTAVRRVIATVRPYFAKAIADLENVATANVLGSVDQRIHLLDKLISAQRARKTIESQDSIGKRAFGNRWLGVDSNWDALGEVCKWEADCRDKSVPSNIHQVISSIDDTNELNRLVQGVAANLKPMFEQLQQLFAFLKFNVEIGFQAKDLRGVPLRVIRDRLQLWQESAAEAFKWSNYVARYKAAKEKGFESVGRSLHDGRVKPDSVAGQFEIAFYESLLRCVYERTPELARFRGEAHERVMDQFRKLDLERIAFAQQEAALAHYENLPSTQANSGELGALLHEIKKKSRHKPIRKLLAEAGHAVQQIKPVFMMSPLSVAQYLQPGILEFDLLLIDEASQVRPVDALGAIARCRQIVVVGDERQMPPSNFFGKMLGGGEEEGEEDEHQAGDLESILGLCLARNISQRMLRWHYRSRHHSLIAVSNHEFYDNRLYVIPSPFSGSEHGGLVFRHIANGYFERGKSRTNPVEAKAVADAVIAHALETPSKTLGVGTFSVAQRDAILDELELLRRQNLELESFFVSGGDEPFFVKNLENIQGDERDVIFISIGYAQDADGYKAMSFGPLQNDGGERRLNVLISRAKERCEVFSTITSDYIDPRRAKSRGAHALKTFLSYAQTGNLDVPKVTGGEFDSEFELQVANAVSAHGYQLESQVGVAGFFIDLAVVDPDEPGRYLLGIECDGAQYHSSRSARDRDRLRQQVLEDRGWIIHRIWSTDWFNNPDDQLRETLQEIEAAKLEWKRRDTEAELKPRRVIQTDQNVPVARHERNESDGAANEIIATVPYVVAQLEAPTDLELHETPIGIIASVVLEVVRIEGPIHVDEVVRRTAATWGLARAGNRIKLSVSQAIKYCSSRNLIAVEDDFCISSKVGESQTIRDRSTVESTEIRKPEYLSPTEVEAAIRAVVAVCVGIETDKLTSEASKLFGFKSTGRKLKEIFSRQVKKLCSQGKLVERQGKLYLPNETTS